MRGKPKKRGPGTKADDAVFSCAVKCTLIFCGKHNLDSVSRLEVDAS